jgi:hypothetical protein
MNYQVSAAELDLLRGKLKQIQEHLEEIYQGDPIISHDLEEVILQLADLAAKIDPRGSQ